MSSKRNIRRRRCSSKRSFSTLDEALKVCNFIRRRSGGDVLRAYKCSWCGLFHYGHINPNFREAS